MKGGKIVGELYYLGNARTQAQYQEMVRLEAAGVCLFCPEGFSASKKQIIAAVGEWTLTTNDFPYEGTLHHFLIVPLRHVTDLCELTGAELSDLALVIAKAKQDYCFDYYGLGARNGDPAFTGGTIRHLHFHLIVGNPHAEKPVKLKLSSTPK